MTRSEMFMAAGDLLALVCPAFSWRVSARTRHRIEDAKHCPGCGGVNAGYIHRPECTGLPPKE